MGEKFLTRRQVSAGLITVVSASLAGCTGDENGDDETGDDVTDDAEDDEADGTDEAEDAEDAEDDVTDDAEDDAEGDDTEFDVEDPTGETAELTVNLENENGEPVSSGVSVQIEAEDEDVAYVISEEVIEEGEATTQDGMYPGEATVTIEGEEFETVEEQIEVGDEEEEEITVILEGTPGDNE